MAENENSRCESCGRPCEALTPVPRWGNICPECQDSIRAVVPEKEPLAPARWDPFGERDDGWEG